MARPLQSLRARMQGVVLLPVLEAAWPHWDVRVALRCGLLRARACAAAAAAASLLLWRLQNNKLVVGVAREGKESSISLSLPVMVSPILTHAVHTASRRRRAAF